MNRYYYEIQEFKYRRIVIQFFLVALAVHSNTWLQGQVKVIDSRHYSNVFGEIRNYQVLLPPGYYNNPLKKYPVIYFLHGWSERYFTKYNINGIENLVSAHDVIVVKPDGYNRSSNEEYYVRPYNIGPVETYRQFPIYFPELVTHIDAGYRTIAGREHRAIMGFSMSGFMSFLVGGKYPHLFSFVGSFCGSPEFIVGPKDLPVEYRHIDMFRNYDGVSVRLHYGDQDFRSYHEDHQIGINKLSDGANISIVLRSAIRQLTL